MNAKWHPRGETTWPNWRDAPPGTRVEHVRSGATGTFVKPSKARNNGAIIDWDPIEIAGGIPIGTRRGYVVAAAFDLRPIA
jgi:hypothetical protein